MPGVTKHIFEHEIREIIKMWNRQIKSLEAVLPRYYTELDIVALLKKYYPHEWKSVEYIYDYYQSKDRFLKSRFGKIRYGMKTPEELLKTSELYKKIMKESYKQIHNDSYSEERKRIAQEELWNKRVYKIQRIDKKIEKSLSYTQQVTPSFIFQLIGLYNRKNTSQKDKMYILLELKKYYSPQIIQFSLS